MLPDYDVCVKDYYETSNGKDIARLAQDEGIEKKLIKDIQSLLI